MNVPVGSSPPRSRKRRTGCLIAIGVLLVVGGWAIQKYWLTRPMGFGPAGPALPPQLFQEVWTNRPVLLLGIGDSVTAGMGASRPELSYFNRLVRNPTDDFPALQGNSLSRVLPNLQVKNLAVSGSTSLQHEQVIQRFAEQSAETLGIVVMTSGGNDLIHWYGRTPPREGAMYGATLAQAGPWIDAFERRLDTMIQSLEAKFPGGCHIFLGDIYDPTDSVGDAPSVFLPKWPDGLAIHAAYNKVIHQCAVKHKSVHIVPIYATFLGHGSHCTQFWRKHYCAKDPYYWYFHNVEDPNDRGYDALRRIFLREIAAVMKLASRHQQSNTGTLKTASPAIWQYAYSDWPEVVLRPYQSAIRRANIAILVGVLSPFCAMPSHTRQ